MRIVGGVSVLTGLLCGFQVFSIMMMSMWGAPTSVTHSIAFWGAVLLVIAGFLLLLGFWHASWFALSSLAMLWTFYAPALFVTLSQFTLAQLSAVLMLIPPSLLLLLSFLVLRMLIFDRRGRSEIIPEEGPLEG